MRALAASDILQLWETAQLYHPVDRALAILAAAEPEQSRDALAALPLGQRDQRLLTLRRQCFGDQLSGHSTCPHCNETIEFTLSCRTLQTPPGEAPQRMLQLDNYTLQVRPFNSFDLAAAAEAEDVEEAQRRLLQRCLLEVRCDDEPVAPHELPPAVNTAIAAAALAADPQAEMLLDLACPTCARRWQPLLDIAQLFWAEIAAQAQRLLMEVHVLARAYGWREADILGLSAARRANYLQKVMT